METILCAAIRRVVPRTEGNLGPTDIRFVELGYRHFDIFNRFGKDVSNLCKDQGFFTSLGRFVSREEAFDIAKASGQIQTDQESGKLYSEDLY